MSPTSEMSARTRSVSHSLSDFSIRLHYVANRYVSTHTKKTPQGGETWGVSATRERWGDDYDSDNLSQVTAWCKDIAPAGRR